MWLASRFPQASSRFEQGFWAWGASVGVLVIIHCSRDMRHQSKLVVILARAGNCFEIPLHLGLAGRNG